jgi:hypothetical protein
MKETVKPIAIACLAAFVFAVILTAIKPSEATTNLQPTVAAPVNAEQSAGDRLVVILRKCAELYRTPMSDLTPDDLSILKNACEPLAQDIRAAAR